MRARTKQKPRKHRPRFLIAFLILAALVVLGASVLTLPLWKIKDVVVNGAKMLSPNEVRALAGIPLSENLFLTSFSRAKTNLSKITAIKDFRIYRIPPATVLISITERIPIATLVFPEKSVIIDKEGYILNRNPNVSLNIPNLADLPVVSGLDESEVLKGDKIDPKVSQMVEELGYFLEARRMQLELGGFENVSFLLDDLLQVKVGDAEQMERKMEVFEALLPVIAGKWAQVEYVDVRFPDNPVIKYR